MTFEKEQFKVRIPENWDAEQDVQFVVDTVGHADESTLLEQLADNYACLGRMLSNGIRYFLGQKDSGRNAYLDDMSVASKLEILDRLIRETPPQSGNLERFEQNLANCVIAESEYNRILYKYAVNTEKLWLSELQISADILKTAEMFLDESIDCEYNNYPAWLNNPRQWSGRHD